MDAFASIISNNVNTIMKRMTSLSIVLMLPTLIASFYGMNVDIHLEEVPFRFLADCALLHRIVNIGVRDIPENQMVLNSTQNLLYGILLHIIEVVQTCKIKTACHLI